MKKLAFSILFVFLLVAIVCSSVISVNTVPNFTENSDFSIEESVANNETPLLADSNVVAAAERRATFTTNMGNTFYQGSNYYFYSYFKLTTDDSMYSSNTVYTKSLIFSWVVSATNFVGAHDMGIEYMNVTITRDGKNIKTWSPTSKKASSANTETIYSLSLATEGKYTFTWSGRYESWGTNVYPSGTFSFIVDRSAPTISLSGVSNGGYTNKNVTVNWSDSTNTTVTANKNNTEFNYTKNSILSSDGVYKIIVTDSVNLSSQSTFTIDKTPPTISLSNGLKHGSYTNQDFTVSGDDKNFSRIEYKNSAYGSWSSVYSKSYKITSDGTWYFRTVDLAGNTSESLQVYRSIVNPTGTLTGVTNGGRTKNDVKFTWISDKITDVLLDGKPYTSGTYINKEGKHTIQVSDLYGNINFYNFEIDKTPPAFTLSGVEQGGRTNQNVSISWSEPGVTATLNGLSYSSGTIIGAEGNYVFSISDSLNNTSSFKFTIDKTAPIYELVGVTNGGRTNKNVRLSWTEASAYATLNGENYESNKSISAEGNYTIILSDALGNSVTVTFEIDKTPPTFTLSGVEQGGRTNRDVKFSWTEIGATAKLNDSPISNPSIFQNDGRYNIVLADALGNTATISFEIDKTPPTFELIGVTNGGRTNKNVALKWSESSASATLNGESYASNTTINIEGSHEIILSDALGNSITISFEIDKTPPTFELIGVTNGGRTNTNVIVTWSELGATATLNGNPYSSSSIISAEGKHTITLSDSLGNTDTITFEIDKTPPKFELVGVTNGGFTNKNVRLTWTEPSAFATINGEPYSSGTIISEEGRYNILLRDQLGNTVTIGFEIDKTPPAYSFSIAPTNFKNEVYYFNTNLYIRFTEAGASAKIDGTPYISGAQISCPENTTRNSIITITDYLGNAIDVKICISKEKYLDNYNYFLEKYKASEPTWWETYDYTLLNNKYQPGMLYSFVSRDNIISFALQREQGIVEYHDRFNGGNSIFCDYANRYVDSVDVSNLTQMIGMPYQIYRSIDNPNGLTAYFDQSKLQAAINYYTQISITQKYLPSKPATPFPGLADIPVQLIYRAQFYANVAELEFPNKPNNIILYVNGRSANYNTIRLTEGSNLVEEVDFAGNITSYVIVVDPKPAKVNAYDFGGGLYEDLTSWFNDRELLYVSHQFRINVIDSYDDSPIFTITREDGSSFYVLNGYFDFTDSGTYILNTFDVAGNQRNYTIHISLTAPSITSTEIIENYKIVAFNYDILFTHKFEALNNITIERYDELSDSWLKILRDDKNLLISIENLNYYFFTNGKYRMTLIDNLGRETINIYEFAKDAPQGHLFNDKNLEVRSGMITNRRVYFTWEESSCFATLNGSAYIKNTFITDEGTYTIRLEDRAGNYSLYSFTIDKTAPIGILDGVTNGSSSNKNVTFTWDEVAEFGTTAVIKKSTDDRYFDYSNGSVIVDDGVYEIILTDAAGNSRTYSFSIKKSAPKVKIMTSSGVELKNNAVTRENIYFSWTESGATATLNGKNYSNNSVIRTAGNYVLIISDNVGNIAYYNVVLDNVAPNFTLEGVEQGGRTNRDVILTWSEAGASATLNGVEYTSGAVIDFEGPHVLILSDALGNSVTINFVIDKTPPTYEISGLGSSDITNQNVRVSWAESSAYATLNGAAYTNNKWITAEGQHEIILSDVLGNSVSIKFTIDKTPPKFTVNGMNELPPFINYSVSFSWTEDNLTAALNGVPYNKNALISSDNKYQIILTDRAGNQSSCSFEIRRTIADYTLEGVKPNGYTKNPVKFIWTEAGASAKLNGQNLSSGTIINTEGEHEIIFTDRYGNTDTVNFTIDKNVPSVELIGVVDKGITNNSVTIVWSDASFIVTVNGSVVYSGAVIDVATNTEEKFNVVATSRSGVENSYTFTIDKILPIGELTGVTNGGRTNTNVSFKWSELGAVATLNGLPYSSGKWISADGNYEIVLSDRAGNQTIYNFEIYRQLPTFILNGVEDGGLTNQNVSIDWFDELISATLNGEPYTSGTIIEKEGKHTISLFDDIGNSVTFTFEIDKTPPNFEFVGVDIGGKTCNKVKITWTELNATAKLNGEIIAPSSTISLDGDYYFEICDAAGNISSASFSINTQDIFVEIEGLNENNRSSDSVIISWNFHESSATLNGMPYQSGDIIDSEGNFTFIIYNDYGKSFIFEFEIDKTPPVYSIEGVYNNGFTNENVRVLFSEPYVIATINGEPYTSGIWIKLSGNYEIILEDDLMNRTIITFGINKEMPSYILDGVPSNGRTNQNVTILCDDPSVISIFVNGKEYQLGDEISAEGEYIVEFINNVNLRFTTSFEIDKTPPNYSIEGVTDGGRTNQNVSISWTENNVTAFIRTGDSRTEYYRTLIKKEGNYILDISDDLGNTVTISFEIDKTPPSFTLNGVEQGGRTNSDVILTWTESGATATLNGIPYSSGDIIDSEGDHEFVLNDELGNSVTFTFEIDKTPPSFTLSGVEQGGCTNQNVSIQWSESSAYATLNETPYTMGRSIREEGSYVFSIFDALGNSFTFTFEIDKTPPTFELIGVTNGGFTNSPVSFVWNEGSATATLNDLPYNSGEPIIQDGFHTIILSDPFGNSVTVLFEINTEAPKFETNLSGEKTNFAVWFSWSSSFTTATLNGEPYKNKSWISADGDYTFVITNKYGNQSSVTFSVKQTIDDVFLNSPSLNEPFYLEDGKSYKIYSEFTLSCGNGKLMVNDIEMPSTVTLTDIGTYSIKVIDDFGNMKEFVIEITEQSTASEINDNVVLTIISIIVVLLCILLIFLTIQRYRKKSKVHMYKENTKK